MPTEIAVDDLVDFEFPKTYLCTNHFSFVNVVSAYYSHFIILVWLFSVVIASQLILMRTDIPNLFYGLNLDIFDFAWLCNGILY